MENKNILLKKYINKILSESNNRMDQMFLNNKNFDIFIQGKPSLSGDKISIVGKSIEDSMFLYDKLNNWLSNHNIAHKFGTKKRVSHPDPNQSKKLVTIYVPDDMDIQKLLIKIEYLIKSYTGWGINYIYI